jgi:hypothetical protein
MEKIIKIDSAILYILGAVPMVFYLHGFLLTGVQIFDISTKEGVLSSKQNITVQYDVKDIGEVLDSEEERKKILAETNDDNERFGQAVRLSSKLGTVKDVSEKEMVTMEGVKDKSGPAAKTEEKEQISKLSDMGTAPVDRTVRKKISEVDDKVNGVTKTDRLIIKRSSSILAEKEVIVPEDKVISRASVFKSIRIGGKFVGFGRVEIGKDNAIFIRNTEPFKIASGHTVPKNTVMAGFISVSDNKLMIDISKVEIDGLDHRTVISVCDANGAEGIALSDINELYEDSQNELDEIINGSMDNINLSVPMLGSITLPSIRRKDNDHLQIFFDKATDIKLLVKS